MALGLEVDQEWDLFTKKETRADATFFPLFFSLFRFFLSFFFWFNQILSQRNSSPKNSLYSNPSSRFTNKTEGFLKFQETLGFVIKNYQIRFGGSKNFKISDQEAQELPKLCFGIQDLQETTQKFKVPKQNRFGSHQKEQIPATIQNSNKVCNTFFFFLLGCFATPNDTTPQEQDYNLITNK